MYVFFFKQKTAYEMRISDWSSDVCSSDLFVTRPLTEERRELLAIVADRFLRAARRRSAFGRQPLDLAVYIAAQSLQLVDPREVLRAARIRDIAGERLSHVLNVAEADRPPALDLGIDTPPIVVRRGFRGQRISGGAHHLPPH